MQQFYINMLNEEKLTYMVYKPSKPMVVLEDKPKDEDEDKNKKGPRVPNKMPLDQYMIYQYEEAEKLKAEEEEKLRKKRKQAKENETKKERLKAVFGDSYNEKHVKEDGDDPTAGIVLKERDVTAPKDKWKVGKELKALQKEFPHDRVLERMIAEEFKTNQLFKYPEEYDLYDAAKERAFKKGFNNASGPPA